MDNDLTTLNVYVATFICSSSWCMLWTALHLLCCHLLTPVCSDFCIPDQSDSLSFILRKSCHGLDTFLAHVHYQAFAIVKGFFSLFGNVLLLMLLWHKILYYLLLTLLMLSGPFVPWFFCPESHLLTGDFIHLFDYGWLFNHSCHHIIIIYVI